ncbi:MAG: hypothetical protein U0002_18070 [Thermoanaerobaculia bacterium]
MEPYRRQQFDFLLATAVERYAERLIQRNGGAAPARARLESEPEAEGVWLSPFTAQLFEDFLLDNAAGSSFVLEALGRRAVPADARAAAHEEASLEALLGRLARAAFAELLRAKTDEALAQREGYPGGDPEGA